MNLTNEDVEEIVKLLDSSFYDELRLKTARFDLRLRRADGGWTQEMVTEGTATPAQTTAKPVPASDDAPGSISVRAPMVGTFYRAPKPGAPPFVDVGSAVTEQTVIGIIETMKLMNSIPAAAAGRVVEIVVPNGELVEAGQVLMRLEKV